MTSLPQPGRSWNFFSADRIIFGSGSVARLPSAVQRMQAQRVLVITDKALVAAGHADRVTGLLQTAGCEVQVFADGEPEPSLVVATKAVELANTFQPGVIVGLGGGSNLDLSKMTAVVHQHGGRFADYFGFDRVPGPVLPLIAIPTTAGTGSEVSHAAVLTDPAQAMKFSTLSPYLRPTLAIVDAELTLSCPPQATADAGIDALTHAVEAFTAVDYRELPIAVDEDYPYDGKTPLGDCLAEKAIALVGEHLVTAVAQPNNLPAREGMALAATLAGLAFSNYGVAVVHALEYPVGGAVHCSHGLGNGLLLPYVMQFNRPARTPELAKIAQLLGTDTSQLTTEAAADAAIEAVFALRRQVGIPHRLRDIGVQESQLPELARKAHAVKRLMTVNPIHPTEEQLLGILQTAW